ncbi:hypothetical protein JCM21900_005053 [Sporobolomyces salmonicolor]
MLVSLRAVLALLLLLAINLSSALASQVHLKQGTDASGKPSITLGIDPTEGFTMVIATYKRDALLTQLLKHLTTKPPPSLRHIVIVWQNVGSPLPDFLNQRSLDQYSTSGVAVTVRKSWKNSMNERFRPLLNWGQDIVSDAVMIMDDDIVLRKEALEWGYQQFVAANDHGKGRIVGFTGRDFEEKEDGTLEYVVKPRASYSMVLSNAAWLRKEWLAKYWEDTQEMNSLRNYVDEVFNCDDILVNYLVSNLTGSAPLLLQPSTPLRTVPTEGLWNRGAEEGDAASVSLSSMPVEPPRPNHFETRKLCLAHYFSHFSAFAPPPSRGRRFASAHYPLIKTSTSVSQDVQDHSRWLFNNELWETPVWTKPDEPELSKEDQELLENEEFDKLLEGMTDEEIDELMKSLEAMMDEVESEEGAKGELQDEEEGTAPSVFEEAARDQRTTPGHIAGEL